MASRDYVDEKLPKIQGKGTNKAIAPSTNRQLGPVVLFPRHAGCGKGWRLLVKRGSSLQRRPSAVAAAKPGADLTWELVSRCCNDSYASSTSR